MVRTAGLVLLLGRPLGRLLGLYGWWGSEGVFRQLCSSRQRSADGGTLYVQEHDSTSEGHERMRTSYCGLGNRVSAEGSFSRERTGNGEWVAVNGEGGGAS